MKEGPQEGKEGEPWTVMSEEESMERASKVEWKLLNKEVENTNIGSVWAMSADYVVTLFSVYFFTLEIISKHFKYLITVFWRNKTFSVCVYCVCVKSRLTVVDMENDIMLNE